MACTSWYQKYCGCSHVDKSGRWCWVLCHEGEVFEREIGFVDKESADESLMDFVARMVSGFDSMVVH